jgi:DNA-binding Lrp family transcriptional regulator
MTYKEIAKKVGMEPVAVARRRKEMEESGLIDVLGEIRNGCSVWSAK